MHGGGAGGAGVLHPRRALEAQIGRGLQHQRSGEILRREAGIEMAEHDLVDVLGGDAGICERFARHFDDEAFDGLVGELAEWRVRPSHDAGSHVFSLMPLCSCRIWSLFLGSKPLWRTMQKYLISGFRFAFERPLGLDSAPPELRKPFVNPSRPVGHSGMPGRPRGADQPNGPRHVQHLKFLRALTLGIALLSLFAATSPQRRLTPARQFSSRRIPARCCTRRTRPIPGTRRR